MITLKNLTLNIEHVVTPTCFPDGTQQVWKLPPEILTSGKKQIIWHFERDGEFITLCQLAHLLDATSRRDEVHLVIPFFPYGRQDKVISNDTTFGLNTILFLLNNTYGFYSITTFDIHSIASIKNIAKVINKNVDTQVQAAIYQSEADFVCFPDKGATTRGYETLIPSFHLSKTRDQSTGQITGLYCDLPLDLEGQTILIVDDICDGGKTFIEAAKVLYGMGADKVDLYVTHGIFSKGTTILRELGGINHIYTTDSYKSLACDVGVAAGHVTVLKLEL